MKDTAYKKITGAAAALKASGRDPKTAFPDVSKMPKDIADYTIANLELVYIVEAVNLLPDGTKWQPDFTGNETHYEPYHGIETKKKDKVIPSGVGFSYSGYVHWYSFSYVGARHIFRDYDRWKFVTTKFEGHYIRTKLMKPASAEKSKVKKSNSAAKKSKKK